MNAVNISTKRTAVNVGVIAAIVAVICKVFGWTLNIDTNDLLVLSPVIAFVAGFGYRLSRWATAKWPTLGWVLFGSGKEPSGIKAIKE